MKLRHLAVVTFSVIMACIIIVPMSDGVAHAFFTGRLPKGWWPGAYTHFSITETAFKALAKESFSIADLTYPMKRALFAIKDANADVDKDSVTSAWHFDGENFVGGQNRIIGLELGVVIDLHFKKNALMAQRDLGSALHTVQDFYAHSNWIELGHREPNPDLGRPNHTLGPVAGPQEPTCAGSKLITKKLTSGYYGGEDRPMPRPSKGSKCRHGGPGDKSPGKGGINKDVPCTGKIFSPHCMFHKDAGEAAIQATKQFIRDIKASVSDREFKLLFGVISAPSQLIVSLTKQFGRHRPYKILHRRISPIGV